MTLQERQIDLEAAGVIAAASAVTTKTVPYTAAAGTDGTLRNPYGIAASNGVVYVCNTSSNVVAALSGGSTSVIAGSLEGYGLNGDGGNAVDATFYQPGGVAVDSGGTIFIADSGDDAVRKINPDGTISRVAGTGFPGSGRVGLFPFGVPATRTALNSPMAVAVNSSGDVFIADTYNNRVVRVNTSGQMFAVAGADVPGYAGDGRLAAFALLSMPTGVAVDAKDNLYIADSANNVIRRVDAVTGVITTVAGNYAAAAQADGLGGFSGDGGPATAAQLNDPQGVALDGAGNLYIADTFNNALRQVTPDGVISTPVPSAGYPYAAAVDASDDSVYIAATGGRKITQVLGLAQSGSAAGPTGR